MRKKGWIGLKKILENKTNPANHAFVPAKGVIGGVSSHE